MIYCCMSATFKIYSISSEINNEELSAFSSKYFGTENRLTVVELIKSAKASSEIADFFTIIKKDQTDQKQDDTSTTKFK